MAQKQLTKTVITVLAILVLVGATVQILGATLIIQGAIHMIRSWQGQEQGQAKQPDQQKAERETAHQRMTELRQRYGRDKRVEDPVMREKFDRWFEELRKAHEENDREKIEEVLKKHGDWKEEE